MRDRARRVRVRRQRHSIGHHEPRHPVSNSAALRRDHRQPALQGRAHRRARRCGQPRDRAPRAAVSRLVRGRRRPGHHGQRPGRPALPRAPRKRRDRPERGHRGAEALRGRGHRARQPPVDADQPPGPADPDVGVPRAGGAVGDSARTAGRDVRSAARDDRARDRGCGAPLRAGRRDRTRHRFHRRAGARCARLPDQPVPVAAGEQAHRPLGRRTREPRPLPARSRTRVSRRRRRRLSDRAQAELFGLPAGRLQRRRMPAGGPLARRGRRRPARALGRQLRAAEHDGREGRQGASPGTRSRSPRARGAAKPTSSTTRERCEGSRRCRSW